MMPEALPTSMLAAALCATIGTTAVRLRWNATYDQLAVLWLMVVFGFGFIGAPLILAFGWRVGLSMAAIGALAPAVAYRFHLGGGRMREANPGASRFTRCCFWPAQQPSR